jgi:hypothetical protein
MRSRGQATTPGKDGSAERIPTFHYLGLAYECEKAPSDIDRILNGVARDSPIIDMPEENTAAWEGSRKFRTEKWLADFNHYRQRLGLPEA